MEFNANSHHATSSVSDADCGICHAEISGNANHQNNSVQLLDPDQTGTVYTVTDLNGQRDNLTANDIDILTTFCQNCHDDDGAARLGINANDPFGDGISAISAIGTHSNQDFRGVEADFHAGCIQCHTSHGSSNRDIIASYVIITPTLTSGPVVFTTLSGAGSFDDGTGNGLCVLCHTHSSNPGYPMTNHSGGLHTRPSVNDQRGENCTLCHPHEPDGDTTTRNGHMSSNANALGLHGLWAQSGLWPVVGLGSVLVVIVLKLRKHTATLD